MRYAAGQKLPRPPPARIPSKERKHRRFDLQFPVCLSFPSGGVVRELDAISENVSIGGLLLKANDHVPPRTPVSLTMDVQGPVVAPSAFVSWLGARS